MAQPNDNINPSVCNTLMLSHVWRNLPTSRHHAWTCSAGSKGYCATKDMLQNGILGHTLLIESRDLREVDGGGEDECCVIYNFSEALYNFTVDPNRSFAIPYPIAEHIPPTTKHIAVYTNTTFLPNSFLWGANNITSIDLGPVSHITEIHAGFLVGCAGLKELDMAPLTQLEKVGRNFGMNCTGLTTINLSPLSKLVAVPDGFLSGCCSLSSLDLSALSQVAEIDGNFLYGCSGLTVIDLSPLANVTEVEDYFLGSCTGLSTVDISVLGQVSCIAYGMLDGCPRILFLDNPPPLCNPPYGWALTTTEEGASQWVRE